MTMMKLPLLSLLYPCHHYYPVFRIIRMMMMVIVVFGLAGIVVVVVQAVKTEEGEGEGVVEDYGANMNNNNNNVCHENENDNTCRDQQHQQQQQQQQQQQAEEEDYSNDYHSIVPSSNWIQPLRHLISYVFEKYVLDNTLHPNDDELELDYTNMAYYSHSHSHSHSQDTTNTNTYFTSHPDRVSLAAVAIWAYLIPQLYIEYSQFKLSLDHQHQHIQLQLQLQLQRKDDPQRRGMIQKALTRCFWGNLIFGMILYCVSASIVCYMTSSPSSSPSSSSSESESEGIGDISNTNNGGGGLDRRASDIVTGLSRLFAGVISLMLSVKICQWLGVYKTVIVDSQKRRIDDDDNDNDDDDDSHYATYYYNFKSIRELKFDFSYALQNRLISCYSFHLYFSCDTNGDAQSIKYGTLGGILLGTCFILIVNKSRTHPILKQYRYLIAILMTTILLFSSLICIGLGIYFIERVWREDRTTSTNNRAAVVTTLVELEVPKTTFRICCIWVGIVCFGVHGAAMYLSHNVDTSTIKTAAAQNKESTTIVAATSNNNKNDKNGSKIRRPASARYKSEVFQEGAPGLKQIKKLLTQGKENEGGEESDEIQQTTMPNKPTLPPPPSYLSLITSKINEIYGFGGGGKTSSSNNNIDDNKELSTTSTSTSTLLSLFQFGRQIHYIVWYITSIFFLFMTIVNIGSTYQQNIVRLNLNGAFTKLYPSDYHTGKMCAWDNKSSNGHIRTFNTLEEVTNNYTIIHCGECAACSNWNDLKLQWTTRNVLAKIARKCAQKSILGTIENVQECNEKTIGFTSECAKCWTEDELCARDNCFWIYLQSTMINAMTDFRVQIDDITSATCDEALCGPEFGPCVGAIRRRMNIKSAIERPISQQCLPVQEDWSVIFDHE